MYLLALLGLAAVSRRALIGGASAAVPAAAHAGHTGTSTGAGNRWPCPKQQLNYSYPRKSAYGEHINMGRTVAAYHGICSKLKREVAQRQQGAVVRTLDPQQLAELVYPSTAGVSPSFVGRMGNTEAMTSINAKAARSAELQQHAGAMFKWSRAELGRQSGVFGLRNLADLQSFTRIYQDAVNAADVLQITLVQCREHLMYLCYFQLAQRPLIEYKVDDVDSHKWWLQFLATLERRSARLLVVTPFVDTVLAQLPKLDRIHPGHNLTRLANRIRLLRTPQYFAWARGTDRLNASWFDVLASLRSSPLFDPSQSDVVLLGCGAYGMPLAAHAKSLGMGAVYVGGLLQTLFGIRGHRFETGNRIAKLMNKHWMRPLPTDMPTGQRDLLEGGAYWRRF